MKPSELIQFISLFNKFKDDIKFEVYSSNGSPLSINDIEIVKVLKIHHKFLDDNIHTKFNYKALFQIKLK